MRASRRWPSSTSGTGISNKSYIKYKEIKEAIVNESKVYRVPGSFEKKLSSRNENKSLVT